MDEKNEFLSITQMAKLRDVTTETLRHYDRIGLLPHDYMDQNRVRYYSVLKYEKLGTIKELKQLGMTLGEIRAYFENRNYENSKNLLSEHQKLIEEKIRNLQYLQKKISGKLQFLEKLEQYVEIEKPYIRRMPERYYIAAEQMVTNEIELSYEAMKLEKKIYEKEEYIPIYATARYGGIFKIADYEKQIQVILFVENPEMQNARVLDAGKFLCVQTKGSFWKTEQGIRQLQEMIKEKEYKIVKPYIIENVLIDYTITDVEDERIYELQIPIY